jgi:hypothetical protein
MSSSVVVCAAVGTMVGTSRLEGEGVEEDAGVVGLEVGTEGARMGEVTIGGCLIPGGEVGEGGEHHLDRLDVGTRHRTGGDSFCTVGSRFFFVMLCLIYAYVQMVCFDRFLLPTLPLGT